MKRVIRLCLIEVIMVDSSKNEKFEHFCEKHGIKHNFSPTRTPQQNGLVGRKNRSLEEIVRTMLNESSLPKYFLVEKVNTVSYVLNHVLLGLFKKKTLMSFSKVTVLF